MTSSTSRIAILIAAMWVLVVSKAPGATTLPVVNPGFEDTTGSASLFNEFSFGSFLGWSGYDDPPGLIGNGAGNPFYVGTLQPQPDPNSPGDFVFFPDGAPEGSRVAIAFTNSGSGDLGEYGLEQTLVGVPLQPFRTYRLRVEVGNIASGIALNGGNFDLSGFPGYRVDLMAGGVPIASDDSQLSGVLGEGEFATSVVTFATDASDSRLGLDLGIRLVNLNEVDPLAPTADLEVDFDDVRIDFVPSLAGDFNFDGAVNGGDYTVWRDTLDSETDLAADANENGIVDAGDYDLWASNYGATLVAAESQSASAEAVPEPCGASLLLFALLSGASQSLRR